MGQRIGAFAALFAVVVLAGCATNPNAGLSAYARTMQEAQARYRAHDVNGAKRLYQKAADLDPTAATPWAELAHINFNEQNYGYAIIYSHEVLQRDPDETAAQSVLTISGLRVAIEALGQLHEENDPKGPAHVEAEKLAAKMREVLGQKVLVPPRSHHRRRSGTKARSKPPAARPTSTPSPPAAPPPSTNPFQALPGNDS